ncbi:MAG: terminase family protein [Bacilli bacterium]
MSKKSKEQVLLEQLQLYFHDKPKEWFTDVLRVELDEQQEEFLENVKVGCRICVKSSKGTGKTFLIAGLTLMFLFCYPDTNIRVISPSYDQLIDVFMRECNQHHKRMLPEIAAHIVVKYDKVVLKDDETQMAVCISAQSTKRERQSGVHAFTQVYLFDEGSGIPDSTFSNALGSLGTAHGGGYVIIVSNPERGSQPFYTDLFTKKPKGWNVMTFDAFHSKQTSPEFIEEIRELYGEDSDEWRVMIMGEFARSDGSTYIPMSLVEDASQRIVNQRDYISYPIVIGVDVGRSKSGDSTVFCVRQGCKVLDIYEFQTDDTMIIVSKLRDLYSSTQASVIYMDADGVGGPVADRCREVGLPVVDVRSSLPSSDPRQYANIRTQLWGEVREWLVTGSIPNHQGLQRELGTMTWGYSAKMAEQLTSKKRMTDNTGKKIPSPNTADALAYSLMDSALSMRRRRTKALPVIRRSWI